jgi:transcription antitermination factor NusG
MHLFASSIVDGSGYCAEKLPSWYAVHVRSNFERRVTNDLTAKGIETYLPATTAVHQWKDRQKRVETPLFPGYTFAKFYDTAEHRLSVLGASGVVRILGSDTAIEPIPDLEVDQIRRLINAGVSLTVHSLIRESSVVRILRGPLQDLEGAVIQVKSQTRLIVSLHLLCRSVSAEIDAENVELLQ